MVTVFKYAIDPYNSETQLPVGAEILSVAFQHANFCLWAKIHTKAKTESRYFEIFGTGEEIPSTMDTDYKFVGTAHSDNGLVFHAFERLGL